jgi:AcrR family transcriptional regulator
VTGRADRVGRDITVEERRASVLAAAVGCIAESGWETVRLRDVAARAGVSIGLLQHYFESREQLIAQAFGLASRDILEQAPTEADLDPWARIVGLVEHLSGRDDLRAQCLLWVEFAAAASRHDAIRGAFAAIYDEWGARLRAAVDAGVASGELVPVLAVDDAVEVILEQIDGCILAIASGLDRVDGARMRELTLHSAAALLGRRTP